MNSLDRLSYETPPPYLSWLEQLICNSKTFFAHVFTELRTLLTLAVLGKRIRAALRRIAPFYSKNFADRRTDREKGSPRARVELFKRPYPAKREGKSPV